ncbi:MAG: GIY-YIG nuclease family protein [Selenomonadaceae bacterium]|nr:GIY-YIG nuclease family protein [Selenomonadaceae bacterium]
MEEQKQIQVFENEQFRVRCFLDVHDVARLHVEDVSRSLGFVETKKHRVATDGDNFVKSGDNSGESGDNFYMAVRWNRVNKYIAEIKKNSKSELIQAVPVPVDKNYYIPENLVYRLAMKANNEVAENFQALLADTILPSIRRTGKYVSPNADENQNTATKNLPPHLTDPKRFCVYAVSMEDDTIKIGKTNDLRRRSNEIMRETHLEITSAYRTGYLPSLIASEIESACLRAFDFCRTHGEFFKASFAEVRAKIIERAIAVIEIDRACYVTKYPDANAEYEQFLSEIPASTELASATSEFSPREKVEYLLECARLTNTDAFRDEILREAIAIMNGQKF